MPWSIDHRCGTKELMSGAAATKRFRPGHRPSFGVVVVALALLMAACSQQVIRTMSLVNDSRVAVGIAPLVFDAGVYFKAQAFSKQLADAQVLHHSTLPDRNDQPWLFLGENVGTGWSLEQVHTAFMNSPSHRANVLDPRFQFYGVGVTIDGNGRYWVVHEFMQL